MSSFYFSKENFTFAVGVANMTMCFSLTRPLFHFNLTNLTLIMLIKQSIRQLFFQNLVFRLTIDYLLRTFQNNSEVKIICKPQEEIAKLMERSSFII